MWWSIIPAAISMAASIAGGAAKSAGEQAHPRREGKLYDLPELDDIAPPPVAPPAAFMPPPQQLPPQINPAEPMPGRPSEDAMREFLLSAGRWWG